MLHPRPARCDEKLVSVRPALTKDRVTLSGQALLLPGASASSILKPGPWTPCRPSPSPGTLHPAAGSVRAVGASPALRSRGKVDAHPRIRAAGQRGQRERLAAGRGEAELTWGAARGTGVRKSCQRGSAPGTAAPRSLPPGSPPRDRTPSSRPPPPPGSTCSSAQRRKRKPGPGSPGCGSHTCVLDLPDGVWGQFLNFPTLLSHPHSETLCLPFSLLRHIKFFQIFCNACLFWPCGFKDETVPTLQ